MFLIVNNFMYVIVIYFAFFFFFLDRGYFKKETDLYNII